MYGRSHRQRERHPCGKNGKAITGLMNTEGQMLEGRGLRGVGRGPEGGRDIMAEREGKVFHRFLVVGDW
jgi:hypothetical protein